MKHIISLKEALLAGGLGAIVAFGLAGCGEEKKPQQEAVAKQGATVFIEKSGEGYKVVDEFPSSQTRVFLRENINGTTSERLLTQAEIDELMKQENAKIESGKSELTNPELSSGGMSLGSAILASAAGAIIGSWIGNKLFNSPGYQAQRQTAYKSPTTYTRSVNSFKSGAGAGAGATKAAPQGKSGFFGSGSTGGAKAGASGGASYGG